MWVSCGSDWSAEEEHSWKFDEIRFSLSFSENVKYFWSCYRHLILVSNPMFLGMGNHVGPFSWASDWSEGQEMGGGAVGGQGPLQGVKLLIWIWHLILVSNPMFFGMGNHVGPFSWASARSKRSRTRWRGRRRSRTSWWREIITLVQNMLETWFRCQTPCFGIWQIIWDDFQEPQAHLNAENRLEGL